METTLTNFSIRKPVADGFLANTIEKSVVKEHTRKTKSGKMSQVKQYTDKRRKQQQDSSRTRVGGSQAGGGGRKMSNGTPTERRTARYGKQDRDTQTQRTKKESEEQGQQAPDSMDKKMGDLNKQVSHLKFMLTKYPDLIDKKKVLERIDAIKEAKRKFEDAGDDVDLAPHREAAGYKPKQKVDLHEHLARIRQLRGKKKKDKKKKKANFDVDDFDVVNELDEFEAAMKQAGDDPYHDEQDLAVYIDRSEKRFTPKEASEMWREWYKRAEGTGKRKKEKNNLPPSTRDSDSRRDSLEYSLKRHYKSNMPKKSKK